MKRSLLLKLYIIFIVAFVYQVNLIAQVGIGTTSPEETLHIAGTARVDNLPLMTSNKVVVADSVGKLGYKILSSSGGLSIETNIDIVTNNKLVFPGTIGMYVRDDINLDLEVTVTVQPNTTSYIRVEYSLPLGAQNCMYPGMEILTYIGGVLYRDGTQIREANRKIQLDPTPWVDVFGSTGTLCSMGFVGCSYSETVTNTSNEPITITYELMGYLEQHYASNQNIDYIYGMWLPFGDNNFNWGDAFIKYQKISF
jgi:hypothetical protein